MELRFGMTNSSFSKETFDVAVDFFSEVFWEKTRELVNKMAEKIVK